MPAPPDSRPDTGLSADNPYPLIVPNSGKIFEPVLPPLGPERPRPAGTSTPSAAPLPPQSRAFSHHLPIAGCHDRTRNTLGNLQQYPSFPEGHPSVPFSGTPGCPCPSRQRRDCRPHPSKFFSGLGCEGRGSFAPKTPIPPRQTRFQSPGRQCYPAAGVNYAKHAR